MSVKELIKSSIDSHKAFNMEAFVRNRLLREINNPDEPDKNNRFMNCAAEMTALQDRIYEIFLEIACDTQE